MKPRKIVYRFGGHQLDPEDYELSYRGEPIAVRPQVFNLLELLVAAGGHIVSKEELVGRLWDGRRVGSSVVTTCVKELRQALGDDGETQRLVRTVHGRGYRIAVPIEQMYGGPTPTPSPVEWAPIPSRNEQLDVPAFPTRDLVEQKPATYLVATFDGTALETPGDPEATFFSRRAFDKWFRDVIGRFEGIVHQFGEGEAVALFGVPNASEDHAGRAMLAAKEIAQGGTSPMSGAAWPRFRVGVVLGEVVIGRDREDQNLHVTPVGEVLSQARKLSRAASPNSVLCNSVTASRARSRHRIAFGSVDDSSLVDALRVRRVELLPATPFSQKQPLRTAFVGRRPELSLLGALLTETQAGRGQVALVVGQPGIGKSRLLHQFRVELARRGVRCLRGRCAPRRRAEPLLPLRVLLRDLWGLTSWKNEARVTAAVEQELKAMGLSPADHAPTVLQILGITAADRGGRNLEPAVPDPEIYETMNQIVRQNTRAGPLAVLVEDLHWIDSASAGWLEELSALLPSWPALLVTTTRPGASLPWKGRACATQVVLPQLGEEDSRSLVTDIVDSSVVTEEKIRGILTWAEGNPKYLEELSLALRNDNEGVARDNLPEEISSLIGEQIDRLDPVAKHVLQVASVLGREAPVEFLEVLIEAPQGSLHSVISDLMRTEILLELSSGSRRRFRFTHALTHEVVYRALLNADRRRLHAKVVRTVEVHGLEASGLCAEDLAHHAAMAELSVCTS